MGGRGLIPIVSTIIAAILSWATTAVPMDGIALDDPLTAAPAPAFPGWEEIARSFARKYGIDEDTWARIGSCETGGTWDPNSYNRSSGASGLYQQMPQYWAERSARYGHPGEDIFDPWANIDVSTQMARDYGFSPWSCA